jgi:hypothetical protein
MAKALPLGIHQSTGGLLLLILVAADLSKRNAKLSESIELGVRGGEQYSPRVADTVLVYRSA